MDNATNIAINIAKETLKALTSKEAIEFHNKVFVVLATIVLVLGAIVFYSIQELVKQVIKPQVAAGMKIAKRELPKVAGAAGGWFGTRYGVGRRWIVREWENAIVLWSFGMLATK